MSDNSKSLPQLPNIHKLTVETKKVQDCAHLLANRLVLLKQEENRFKSRIREVNKKAWKTVTLRKENEEKKNKNIDLKKQQEIEAKEKFQAIKLNLEKERKRKLAKFEKIHSKQIQNSRNYKEKLQNYSTTLKEAHQQELNDKKAKLNSVEKSKKLKILDFYKLKKQKLIKELESRRSSQEKTKSRIQEAIQQMENMETFLISRLKERQAEQNKAQEMLERACTWPLEDILSKIEEYRLMGKGKKRRNNESSNEINSSGIKSSVGSNSHSGKYYNPYSLVS